MSKANQKFNKLNQKEKLLFKLRHSAEHLLMMAMRKFYPKMKMAMGPATDEGFYFDVDLGNKTVSKADFAKLEKEIQRLTKASLDFKKEKISIKKARKLFSGNQYKQEWLDEISAKNKQATIYWTGKNTPDEFVDLCSGPHVANSSQIKIVKLLSVAGAYWRGSEKNKMLSRIYGTAFANQKELTAFLKNLEEAKKRDHRKLGQELDLFSINEKIGPGLILWHPKGNIIKEELENWAKQIEKDWGYQRVTTPIITKAELYYTSGHLPYYKNDMYPPMKLDDGQKYFLKPMNCPHHHMIYASCPRSYKDLPLRLAEYGTCHRFEASGELFGLMRVRGMIQNDAHIYCSQKQAVEEFFQVMKLHEYYYKKLGIKKYHLELALRDPKNKNKYHGDKKMWILAEKLMRQAVVKTNIKMVEEKGSAAFYGPKIDFIVHSSIGRQFAISTNQIDLFMGKQFKLKYTDQSGKQQTPVIIHRAPLGSHERFIGFLIEHFAGNFPVWLSPIQSTVLPISKKSLAYAKKIYKKLLDKNIRAELDDSNETLAKKIRNAETQKIPYLLIIGEKEALKKQVTVRQRGNKTQNIIRPEQFLDKIKKEIDDKTIF